MEENQNVIEENKVAIVIIVYNISNLISKQVECILKFCKDVNYRIVIVDNSNKKEVIEAMAYYATQINAQYIKVFSAESAGSKSNAFACNFAYTKLRDEYAYFLYLDHDTFPIREFSVIDSLDGKMMAGLGQSKRKAGVETVYFQQTSLMWNNLLIDRNLIDFSVSNELGLDTGGLLYRVIEKYGKDGTKFFNEKYYQNPFFREGFYNFYATVNEDMFMHFINGSNWNPQPKQEERINSLINVLNERTGINKVTEGTYPPVY